MNDHENTACILEDQNGKRELQITIHTLITDPKRMSVLMSMAMDQVTQIEREVSKTEDKIIEEWYENYRSVDDEETEKVLEEITQPSPILGPDFAPAKIEV